MNRLALAAAVLCAVSAPAMAASQKWTVTEERTTGIKTAQGEWLVTTEGDKLSGTAELQLDNGQPLTYSFEGAVKDNVYTIKMDKRSDDKKNCVWTGSARAATAKGVATGYMGDLVCDGVKLVIRASGM